MRHKAERGKQLSFLPATAQSHILGRPSLSPQGRCGLFLPPGTQPTTTSGPGLRPVFHFLCDFSPLQSKGPCLPIPSPGPSIHLKQGQRKTVMRGVLAMTADSLCPWRFGISRQSPPFLNSTGRLLPGAHADHSLSTR